MTKKAQRGIGNLIAPPRFLLFLAVTAVAMFFAIPAFGLGAGVMAGFDTGAATFLLAASPLLGHRSDDMRRSASRNDANRLLLLFLTLAVSLVVLVAVASELMQRDTPDTGSIALIVGTLVLSWVFSNTIYALHYAHLAYGDECHECVGLEFPGTAEPDYWDFVYFAFTCGMAFATSDVQITGQHMRRVVTIHCLAAFAFNIGVLAFTINVLGSG
jgi:uncharacterized membrane protein